MRFATRLLLRAERIAGSIEDCARWFGGFEQYGTAGESGGTEKGGVDREGQRRAMRGEGGPGELDGEDRGKERRRKPRKWKELRHLNEAVHPQVFHDKIIEGLQVDVDFRAGVVHCDGRAPGDRLLCLSPEGRGQSKKSEVNPRLLHPPPPTPYPSRSQEAYLVVGRQIAKRSRGWAETVGRSVGEAGGLGRAGGTRD